MAKRGGFPGGGIPGNMNNMMKQVQRMQRQMEEATKEQESKEFTASAGGGADLIVAATNEALRQMEEANSQAMAKLTGGLGGLGGGLPF